MNENTQGSNNQEGEPSLQKSDYYIEPTESQYNNSDETLYKKPLSNFGHVNTMSITISPVLFLFLFLFY